ncbi:MAG: winged helix-turn-helix domain-containing protein [Euryarchaeota archaeon]|nr:winged helix-turn-helix domain-containing protein [Euryarchaeota archaeon]
MSRPFEGLLGNNCELRMLEYLLPLQGIEFNITELAEEVGVSRVTATRIVKKFAEWGVLKSPRTIGNTAYYSINHESPVVKSVEQFNNVLIEKILGDETLYEIHDYWEAQRPQIPSALVCAAGEMLQHRIEPRPQMTSVGFGFEDMVGVVALSQRKEVPAQTLTRVDSSTENYVSTKYAPTMYAPTQYPSGGI